MILFELLQAAAPEPGPTTTGTQILITALGAGGLGAIIAAVVTGLFSKKKLGAEATEIITKAASGVVISIEAELKRSVEGRTADRSEFEEAIAELKAAHAREMEEVRQVLQLHVAWDALAIAKLAEVGVDLPLAPPLLPPHVGSLETR